MNIAALIIAILIFGLASIGECVSGMTSYTDDDFMGIFDDWRPGSWDSEPVPWDWNQTDPSCWDEPCGDWGWHDEIPKLHGPDVPPTLGDTSGRWEYRGDGHWDWVLKGMQGPSAHATPEGHSVEANEGKPRR